MTGNGAPGAAGVAPEGAEPGARRDDVGALVARISEESASPRERASLVGRLAAALGRATRTGRLGTAFGVRWVADQLVDVAPRIPVRDLPTLSAHHGGLLGEELADSLVRAAARNTAAVGAGGGALAAVPAALPVTLLTAPVKLGAETLAVAAIEVKLVAELHEVYGQSVPGSGAQRAGAYIQAWADRRGVDASSFAGLRDVLNTAAKRRLRARVAGRIGRNLTTLGPLLSGALAGGWVNRGETRKLAEAVRADLRRRTPPAR